MSAAAEALEDVVAHADYRVVLSGDDLVYGKSSVGYHDTSERMYPIILATGLGFHPGVVEAHELPFWIATFCSGKYARAASMKILEGKLTEASYLVSKGLASVKDLKVVWFYRERRMSGTSSYRDRRIKFELEPVGDWLTEHSDYVVTTDDGAGGYAIAWRGKAIPPSLLRATPV